MKQLRIVSALLLVLVSQVACAQTAKEFNKQGLHYADRNILIQPMAAQNFLNAILLDSSNAEYHYNLGYSLYSAKLEKYSIPSFTKAIELNPKYADAYRDRGQAFMNLFDYATALSDFEKAVEFESNRTARNYYKSEYVVQAKKGLAGPKQQYDENHYKLFKARCWAIYLNEKWMPLTAQQLYWTANSTEFYSKPDKAQWANADYKKMKKAYPYSRVQAEHFYLEAEAVIYYLEKINKDKPKSIQEDSIAHYIHRKTNQVFYIAAIIYKHFQNDARAYNQEALLKKCNKERSEGIKKILPYLTSLDKDPGQYHRELAYMPYISKPWMDKPQQTVVKSEPVYDASKVTDASCDDKRNMVGYLYSSPNSLSRLKFYVLDFDCGKKQFLVLKVYPKPYSEKDEIWNPNEIVWMGEKDFRVGYKNEGILGGKNFRLCHVCQGKHKVENVYGGGQGYSAVQTDHFNSNNTTYTKNAARNPIKRKWEECTQCFGTGWLCDFATKK